MEINGKYFFIPDSIVQESSYTIHVYIYILNEIINNGGEFTATKSEIAKKLHITERQVRTILSKISEQSDIETKPLLNRSTIFTMKIIEDKNKPIKQAVAKTQVEKTTKTFNFKKSLIDYGFNSNLVEDWLKVRKTKKATNTETAFKAFITEIEKKECNINEMLHTAVTSNWSGFKHKWIENIQKEKEEKIGRTSIETIKKNAEYNGQY